jgi:hypothetical protein
LPVSDTIPTALCFQTAALTVSAGEKLPGPLFEGLGKLHHPVTTSSKQARRYFGQDMRPLFGFNHRRLFAPFASRSEKRIAGYSWTATVEFRFLAKLGV